MAKSILKPDEIMLTLRVPKTDLPILRAIQDSYGLKSRSETVRQAYRQIARERSLINDTAEETHHEAR